MLTMKKFTIQATMKDGSGWETIRWTEDGVQNVITELCSDDTVSSFAITEKEVLCNE